MDQLIATKLHIPQPRSGLVQRSRLVEKLNGGLDCKLILVSAPAGFGKSTALSEWVEAEDNHVTWLSIDAGDNDLKRFFYYLISATQKLKEGFGQDVLPILQAADSPQTEHLLTILINDITEADEKFTVILDDYHLINNPDIHEGIKFLLEHMPPNMHLVIASRVDPPFPLMRLRARGQMTEIRSQDLRFNETETRAFLNEQMGLDLTTEDVSTLQKRTEGWITGLHLAALSMQDRADKHEFIAKFSGSHHYIIDYLVGEVLSRQPEEIQTFLLRTSIFDRFCASLSDVVLEITDSKDHINNLEAANLFLISLDDERNWFRYHHLFADFLNQRLRERESENVPEYHRRASTWFEQNNLFPEAINHSLMGEDFEHAAQLMEQIGPDMMMQNEFDKLTTWLDAMPDDLVENWPWLCIIRAWMYDRWAQFELGERYLQHAEAALVEPLLSTSIEGENIIHGQIAAIRALYTLKTGRIPESIEHSNHALEYLPEGYFNRGVASFSLGWAKKIQGDLPGAIKAYEEGLRASLSAGNRMLAQVIILDMGTIQALQGHLHQAAETFREAINFRYEKSQIKIPYASSANVALANILREWNDLDGAMSHLQKGIEIGVASKVVDAIASGYVCLTLVHLAKGNLEAANQACEKAERMVKDIPDLETETISKSLDSRTRLLLAQDRFTEASRYVEEQGLSVDTEINHCLDFKHTVLARVLIHSGREHSSAQALSDAQRVVRRIIEMTRPAGYISLLIEALALQALAFDTQGLPDQALKSLEEALDLAEPGGYVRIFVDEGKPMQALLKRVRSHGQPGDYVKKLLNAFEPSIVEIKMALGKNLVEPLSNRELEVLRMLRTELSGPEIAQHLVISLNTLRTHTKNIYAKLGVGNRRAAVRKAREYELI